jgi:hypothetical protein
MTSFQKNRLFLHLVTNIFSHMFKIYITETIYHHVVDAESQKAASAWSTPPLDAIHQTRQLLLRCKWSVDGKVFEYKQ